MLVEQLVEFDSIVSLLGPNSGVNDAIINTNNESSLKAAEKDYFITYVMVLWFIFKCRWSNFTLTFGDHFIMANSNGLRFEKSIRKFRNRIINLNLFN